MTTRSNKSPNVYSPASIIARVQDELDGVSEGNILHFLQGEKMFSGEHTLAKKLNDEWYMRLVFARWMACIIAIAAIGCAAFFISKEYHLLCASLVGICLLVVMSVLGSKISQSGKITAALNKIPLNTLRL